jgi:hypothetical protein
MKESIFISQKIQDQSNQFLLDSYEQFLSEIREDVNEGETSEHLSEDFQEEFKSLIFRKELNQFSAKNFYWLNLIDSLVDTLFLLEEGDYSPESIVEYFEASEFLGFIITELEMDQSPEIVVNTIKEIQEYQIVSFFNLHLSNKKWNPSGPVAYRPVPELGEGSHGLYLGIENDFYPLPKDIDATALPILKYNPLDKVLQVDLEDEVLEIRSVPSESISIPNGPTLLLNTELIQSTKKDLIIDKYKKANLVLSELCPNLFSNLNQFSKFIVPLDAEELVSYSMKVLPRYSCINLFNRDLVDLVDDLLHENGHHYLNGLLEGEDELIFEDDEKIFYSPWRRSLRPVRGIYHAVLTFFWAYRLFKELSSHDQLDKFFNKDEITKINYRLLEEGIMISECRADLDKAFEMDKITPIGKTFYNDILQEIENDKVLLQEVENSLPIQLKEKIDILREEIVERKPLKA